MNKAACHRAAFTAAACALIIAVRVCAACAPDAVPPPEPDTWLRATRPSAKPDMLNCLFFDEKGFQESVIQAAAYDLEAELNAGVVPHHLLAGGLIASFFKTAAEKIQDLEAVLIVAPNHSGRGGDAVTTLAGWNTPFGPVPCEKDFAAALSANGAILAKRDDARVEADHSASALLPYAAHYFGGVPVGVCLLSASASEEKTRAVADEALALAGKRRVLLLVSADFSHYLPPSEAAARDEETRAAVLNGDIGKIMSFGNEHLDSPPSLSVFMRYAALCGGGGLRVLDHSSSDRILKLPEGDAAFLDGTTTYFIFAG